MTGGLQILLSFTLLQRAEAAAAAAAAAGEVAAVALPYIVDGIKETKQMAVDWYVSGPQDADQRGIAQMDCDSQCGQKGGACSFCPSGTVCCQRNDFNPECPKGRGFNNRRTCIATETDCAYFHKGRMQCDSRLKLSNRDHTKVSSVDFQSVCCAAKQGCNDVSQQYVQKCTGWWFWYNNCDRVSSFCDSSDENYKLKARQCCPITCKVSMCNISDADLMKNQPVHNQPQERKGREAYKILQRHTTTTTTLAPNEEYEGIQGEEYDTGNYDDEEYEENQGEEYEENLDI